MPSNNKKQEMMMRLLRLLAASILIPVVLAGCSGSGGPMGYKDLSWCQIGGAVAGATGGVVMDGGIGGGILGGLAGGIFGSFFCASDAMMASDSDGDGVPDDKDQCPSTPAGAPVDANGCPLYSDGDGVPDYLDKCPGTPAGVKTDSDGCPLDSDGDGVPDSLDKCPNTAAGAKVDKNGCPPAGDTLAIVTNVNFNFDSATIRSDSEAKLDRVVSILKTNKKVRVRIEGHTDSTGPEGYNQGLSYRRAEAVKGYLAGKGIKGSSLSVVGFGEAKPLVSNRSRAGRAVNRRVEFKVLN
ncbi:MAG: OOP family OmpA-OmpF porin [Gammaproteobacteria bacterium]|jgi:OOP family OmpA-OmpF porin